MSIKYIHKNGKERVIRLTNSNRYADLLAMCIILGYKIVKVEL